MEKFSIGVTTYSYRYSKFLIELINQIRRDNDNEIILAVNGNYGENFDEEYRKNILQLCTRYEKIFPFIYPNFRALSKMWNNIVINSTNDYIVLLNDDTSIWDKSFWEFINNNIKKHNTSFKIDRMFCYFVIKKSELDEVGWFDERFLGIGWEDTEFAFRYKKVMGRDFLNINNAPGIKTYIDRENVIINQKQQGKYSKFNEDIYLKKLETTTQYPYEKFYQENKNKL